MKVSTLAVSHFRRFQKWHIECHPTINFILGSNGTGKTSLLEAIWILVSGSSFRTHKLSHLIQQEKKEATIGLNYETQGVPQSLQFFIQSHKREALHNHTKLTPLSNLIGILLAVVISTEDLNLIEGEPRIRRYFLDLMLSQTDPLYLWHLKRWVRGLKTKNQLLKQRDIKSIPFFEKEMAQSASYISEKRFLLKNELSIQASPFLRILSSKESKLLFKLPRKTTEEFLLQWEKERTQEIKLGHTLSGPHKDDLQLFLNGGEAKNYASMGEKKSVMIALKMAQYKLIQKISKETPLLLIDDFSSHLDPTRQENFFKLLTSEKQVFITNPTLPPFIQKGEFPTLELG